ncbi:MAG: hypothetical protein A3E82_05370 [Gammaproteobacteria bacterium RIFCSPHIGHO2_12_FULL_38_11]|nr:MAG: hypothetical protein A3E82_05370 [Gammaproteobacteria bacterium RIFCSPHIGHO2_12_FULL_38_11]
MLNIQTRHTVHKILAALRDGDFTHPGEIEAIDLMMKNVKKDNDQNILDIGSGLGGTTDYLNNNRFGNVIGIDIDSDHIQYATKKYPNSHFIAADVLHAADFLNQKFQLMIAMCSFFCFEKQKELLMELSKIADKNAELIVFDYSQPHAGQTENPFSSSLPFHPIYLDTFKKNLLESGWQYQSHIDISDYFEKCYVMLLNKFDAKKEVLLSQFDHHLVNTMYSGYNKLLDAIHEKKIGGIIVYARRSS